MRDGIGARMGRMCYTYGKGSHIMKTINSVVLVLAVGMLFFASAKHITAGQSQYSRSSDPIFANSLADGGMRQAEAFAGSGNQCPNCNMDRRGNGGGVCQRTRLRTVPHTGPTHLVCEPPHAAERFVVWHAGGA